MPADPSSLTPKNLKFTVIQDGARLHYAVPISLQRAGMLDQVYTDWYERTGWKARLITRAMSLVNRQTATRMEGRRSAELDSAKVHTSGLLAWRLRMGRRRFARVAEYFEWQSRLSANWIGKQGFGDSNVLFGFIRSLHPSLIEAARDAGLGTIGDQIIAPETVLKQESDIQKSRFPGWMAGAEYKADPLVEKFEQESWDVLDQITCSSPYVRDNLIRSGVDGRRVTVIPYPTDANQFPFVDRAGRTGPLVIGFVGGVSLRKGAPYFFEIASKFRPDEVRFVMVGPIQLTPEALSHKGHVELVGNVPRGQIGSWLEKFDLFLFPSTCEGSAGAVLEAMSTGLPVICSPNSGPVFQDGIGGRILSYDDINGMVQAIRQYKDAPELTLRDGKRARDVVLSLSLESYAEKLALVAQAAVNARRS